jgi:hypothetical protein
MLYAPDVDFFQAIPKHRTLHWMYTLRIEPEGKVRPKTWRRVGVVLSVVWLFVGGYWGNSTGLHKGDFAVKQFALCMENSGSPGNASGVCLDQFNKDYVEAIKDHWWDALIIGVVPIPVAWLLVYGLSGLMRRKSGLKAV